MILWVNVLVILAVAALFFFLFTELSKRSVERYKKTYKPYEKSDAEALKSDWEAVGKDMKNAMNEWEGKL